MTELVLITSSGDHGGEFDLEGFAIYPKKLWEKMKKKIQEMDEPFEDYWGSNELVCFDDGQELLDHFKEKDISEDEMRTLFQLLNIKTKWSEFYEKNGYTYGIFLNPVNSDDLEEED